MTENENIERKDNKAANLWTAVVLGIIALTIALIPFFNLNIVTS